MEVKIIGFDDNGQGITRVANKVCFVKRALPEEVIDIEIIKNKKNYLNSKIKKIIIENSERIKTDCPYYDLCGGCNFRHASIELEQKFKINKALNYFHKCDNFYQTRAEEYRNKVTLHVQNGEIGYYQEESHDLLKVDYCNLLNKKLNLIIKILNTYKDDKFNGTIIIRENFKQEIMLVIKGKYAYITKLQKEKEITNLIYNDRVLKGNDYFIEEINNYKFKVHYNSFFQVNREGLLKIIEILESFLENKKINKALDLYSGTSVLGIILSKYVNEVISIEENKNATADAEINLTLNNIKNLKVINGLVEDNLEYFQGSDLILVDPARRGIDKKTINYLNRSNNQYLIYISCEMISLKRDLSLLKEKYNLENLYLVDMFPRTNKVETIAILNKIN